MAKHNPLTKTPIYNSWASMKQRCSNPKNKEFSLYGGRGVSYSQDWETFDGFCKDMSITYKKGLWLERINNDLGYTKNNCIWATPREQQNNRRNNVLIEYGGIVDNLRNWAEFFGIKRSNLANRYYVNKWDFGRCIHTPVRRKNE